MSTRMTVALNFSVTEILQNEKSGEHIILVTIGSLSSVKSRFQLRKPWTREMKTTFYQGHWWRLKHLALVRFRFKAFDFDLGPPNCNFVFTKAGGFQECRGSKFLSRRCLLGCRVLSVEILDLPSHCHMAPFGGCSRVWLLFIHSFVCSNKCYYKTVSVCQILPSVLM